MSKIKFTSSTQIGCLIDEDIKAVVALIQCVDHYGEDIMQLNPTKGFGFFITENLSLAQALLEEGLQRQKLNNSEVPKIPSSYLFPLEGGKIISDVTS